MAAFTRRLIALLVLELDRAISAYRTGRPCGLPALAITSLDGDVQATLAPARRSPSKPDGIELAVLTALADVYGPALLTSVQLGYALRLIADRGAVNLVQRVLWGEAASDGRLAILLDGVFEQFGQLAVVWPEAFLTEASSVLAGFRRGPQGFLKPGVNESAKNGSDIGGEFILPQTTSNGMMPASLLALSPAYAIS